MPRDNPPPLTSKKARRLHQKTGKTFQFTGSQFQAAERRESARERQRKEAEKEQRKKENKRKREQKEEREREAKRLQLADGKISVEDTWAKVRASQPRLNTFFKTPGLPVTRSAKKLEADHLVTGKANNNSGLDSKQAASPDLEIARNNPPKRGIERRSSPIPSAQSLSPGPGQLASMSESTINKGRDDNMHAAMEPEQDSLDAQVSFSGSFWDVVIAEDESAEPVPPKQLVQEYDRAAEIYQPKNVDLSECTVREGPSPTKRKTTDTHYSCFASPSKSSRTVLSEMSAAKVNIRAQEKPDVTSTPKPGSALPSPVKEVQYNQESASDLLALISTQDLEYDSDFADDKENADPWQTGNKLGALSQESSQILNCTNTASQSPAHQKPLPPEGFGDYSDCEDLFDFEFDKDENDFDEGGLDDSVLAAMSTQIPTRKCTVAAERNFSMARAQPLSRPLPQPSRDALSRSLPGTMMPPPMLRKVPAEPRTCEAKAPGRRAESLTKSNSFAFDGVEDDDLAQLAEQLESQSRSTSRQPKKGRMIPWLHPSQFSVLSQSGDEDEETNMDLLTSSPEMEAG